MLQLHQVLLTESGDAICMGGTKQAENGLQSRSSENGKTAVWHYGLKWH